MTTEQLPPFEPLTAQQLHDLVELARAAGVEIMTIYNSETRTVYEKKDLSPLTEADLAANRILLEGLSHITPEIPVVSEESDPLSVKVGRRYWLVDPLDGTRDFVARLDTFVVCLGLIEDDYPTVGIIHSPATGESWWAQKGEGAFADGGRIFNHSQRTALIAAGSRSTPSEKMEKFYRKFGVSEVQRYGSALKFCRLSEGAVDLYPRFGPTCEWDTAAGQAIAEEAGCQVMEISTQTRLRYGKPNLLNSGGFVASRLDLHLAQVLAQGLSQALDPTLPRTDS